jgi:hypothetical protein
MAVKSMYDSLANQYSIADSFGAISESHKCALNQICKALPNARYNALDLNIGDGLFLQKLQQQSKQITGTGIDITKEIPKVPLHSQDLVIAHFINASLPMQKIFEQAHLLTTANGYCSIITSTYESFPVAQQYLANFIAKDSLLSHIVGHYYKSLVKNTNIATSEEELVNSLAAQQFTIINHQRLHLPIQCNNIEELSLFGIDGAWFLNALALSLLPKNFLLQRLKQIFNKIFTFPYQDTHVIDVLLVKK